MSAYICHDFKTPRNDTARRLPNSFRIVPVVFYLALIAGAYFVTMDVINIRGAKAEKLKHDQVKAQHESEKTRFAEEKKNLDIESARATEVAKWIEGTRVIQPLCVRVARSVPTEATLGELILERNEQLPDQFILSFKLVNGQPQHVQAVQTNLEQLNYRSYSPQQSKQGDTWDCRTNLVWQDR